MGCRGAFGLGGIKLVAAGGGATAHGALGPRRGAAPMGGMPVGGMAGDPSMGHAHGRRSQPPLHAHGRDLGEVGPAPPPWAAAVSIEAWVEVDETGGGLRRRLEADNGLHARRRPSGCGGGGGERRGAEGDGGNRDIGKGSSFFWGLERNIED